MIHGMKLAQVKLILLVTVGWVSVKDLREGQGWAYTWRDDAGTQCGAPLSSILAVKGESLGNVPPPRPEPTSVPSSGTPRQDRGR